MGWATGAWAENAFAGTAWATQSAPVEVPDVVGQSQASATTELEGAGFSVTVAEAFSDSVALGLVISQEPEAGQTANSGSAVTITVSLGSQPVTQGGHFVPDYREERDEKRLKEQRELRELIEKAAGLIDEAEDAADALPDGVPVAATATPPKAVFVSQVADLRGELESIKRQIPNPIDLRASRETVDRIIAQTSEGIIMQIAGVLEDLIREISDDLN